MAIKIEDMQRELAALKNRYRSELDMLQQRLNETVVKFERGTGVSDHDAFNMSATCQNLAVLAGKIEQTVNVVRWMEGK